MCGKQDCSKKTLAKGIPLQLIKYVKISLTNRITRLKINSLSLEVTFIKKDFIKVTFYLSHLSLYLLMTYYLCLNPPLWSLPMLMI